MIGVATGKRLKYPGLELGKCRAIVRANAIFGDVI